MAQLQTLAVGYNGTGKRLNRQKKQNQDVDILAEIREVMLEMYHEEKAQGKTPVSLETIEAMTWDYNNPLEPKADELAKENNGYALEDLYDASGKLIAKKANCLSSFAQLRDDGSTSSAIWIYTGQWT